MPTPYGSRGGMAFGADELRVLRRALAAVLHPVQISDDDVRAALALAESVDEAVAEAGRLRAFLLADLARYRSALPGSATSYLGLLRDALAAGHVPEPDDLAALRALRGNTVAAALLERCGQIAEHRVRERLVGASPGPAGLAGRSATAASAPPAQRTRLLTLVAAADKEQPRTPRKPRPEKPAPSKSPGERPVPKPSEVFPPRRKPSPPTPPPPQERVAG